MSLRRVARKRGPMSIRSRRTPQNSAFAGRSVFAFFDALPLRYLSAGVARREAPAVVRKDHGHHRFALLGAPLPFAGESLLHSPGGVPSRRRFCLAFFWRYRFAA